MVTLETCVDMGTSALGKLEEERQYKEPIWWLNKEKVYQIIQNTLKQTKQYSFRTLLWWLGAKILGRLRDHMLCEFSRYD